MEDFQVPMAVAKDCQSFSEVWLEVEDTLPEAVRKAADGSRLTIPEVKRISEISDSTRLWSEKVIRKFGDPPKSHPNPPGGVVTSQAGDRRFTAKYRIVKFDAEQQLVFGWMSELTKDGKPIVDTQGDIIPVVIYEKAAYQFVLDSREGGDMHERGGTSRLVESIVFTKAKQEALGIDLGMEGHWAGFRVDDPELWALVKSGERPAFSIEGSAARTEVE